MQIFWSLLAFFVLAAVLWAVGTFGAPYVPPAEVVSEEQRAQRAAADRLKAFIETTGLPVDEFATRLVVREPATVQDWIDGKQPIPEVVTQWMASAAKNGYSLAGVSSSIGQA